MHLEDPDTAPYVGRTWRSQEPHGNLYDCVAGSCARSIRTPLTDAQGRKVAVTADDVLRRANISQEALNSELKGLFLEEARVVFAQNGKNIGDEVSSPSAKGDYFVVLSGNGKTAHAVYGRRTATGDFYVDDVQANTRRFGDSAFNELGKYTKVQYYPITDMPKLTLDEALRQLDPSTRPVENPNVCTPMDRVQWELSTSTSVKKP